MFEVYGYVLSLVDMFRVQLICSAKATTGVFIKLCFGVISLLAVDMAKYQVIRSYQHMCLLLAKK